MKLLLVEWEDSAGSSGWRDLENGRPTTVRCTTVGYVVEGKKGTTCLVQSICENGDVDHTMSIPNSCIRKRRILRYK